MAAPWPAPASDPGLAGARDSLAAWLGRLPGGLLAPAGRLLERISTGRWLLEWNLPRWLGGAWGLDSAAVEALVVGNALGLGFVRLSDDLLDGEVEGDRAASLLLAAALQEAWLLGYLPLLGGSSPFWGHLARHLAEWRASALDGGGPPGADLRAGDETALLRLAGRGAPLKVCAVAVCLLAGREADLAALEASLDRLLAGAVLVDHAQDWAADLEAGRYNAFVAYCSEPPRRPEEREANRRAVLEELWLGAAGQPYWALARSQFGSAAEILPPPGFPELSAYLAWAAEETDALAARAAAAAREVLRAATEQLVGQPVRDSGREGGESDGDDVGHGKADRDGDPRRRVPRQVPCGPGRRGQGCLRGADRPAGVADSEHGSQAAGLVGTGPGQDPGRSAGVFVVDSQG